MANAKIEAKVKRQRDQLDAYTLSLDANFVSTIKENNTMTKTFKIAAWVSGIIAAAALLAVGTYFAVDAAKDDGPDAVAFKDLKFTCGGFNGANAKLDKNTTIKSFVAVGSDMSYQKDKGGISSWYGCGPSDIKMVACLFVKDASGKWTGGKFEMISESRLTRSFKNINGHYNGWTLANVPNPCDAVFVIIGADGSKRTNVVKTKWQR